MNASPFLLGQNRRLSPPEIARATQIAQTVRQIEESRETYVAEQQLDPRFCLSDEKWIGPSSFFQRVGRHLLGQPDHFNRLRLLSYVFSGFSLLHFQRADTVSERLHEVLSVTDTEADSQLRERIPPFESDLHGKLWWFLRQMTPDSLLFTPPPVCGEIGWEVSGVIVNHDTAAYQERVLLLHALGLLRFLEEKIAEHGVARVLEIGTGYGALARHLKQALPGIAYTLCDLPEALYFSAPYLSFTHPNLETRFVTDAQSPLDSTGAMHFVPNYALPVVANRGGQFDLVINTLSLSELSAHKVQTYGALISRLIGGTGLFFEQNFDNSHLGMLNCKDHLQRHFLRRTQITTPPFNLVQGQVDVWSNRKLTLPYGAAPEKS